MAETRPSYQELLEENQRLRREIKVLRFEDRIREYRNLVEAEYEKRSQERASRS